MDIYPSGIKVPNDPQKGFGKPTIKTYTTPGTFSSVTLGGKVVPQEAISNIPNVGGEVRNPRLQELLDIEKILKDGGFTLEKGGKGVIGINLPSNLYTQEDFEEEVEKKLTLAAAQSKVEIDILGKLVLLSGEYSNLNKEGELLGEKLQNPSTLAVLETVSGEAKKLIDEIKNKPLGEKLDELRQKISEFEKIIARAKSEVAKIPTPPPVTAPVAPVASAPIAAPKPPEPLREYGGWPTSEVFYRKQGKNFLGGWYARRGNGEEYLPEQEVWENESKAFDVAYKRYIDLIKNMKVADKQLIKPLIDAKNAITNAIKNKDAVLVASLREEFEVSLEEWKAKWLMLEKIRTLEKTTFESDKKAAEKIEGGLTSEEEKKNLSRKGDELAASIEKSKTTTLADGLSDEAYNGLVHSIEAYHTIIETYKNTQKSIGVLRPIKVTEKNKDQIIRLINGKTPTLAEWGEEEKMRLQAKSAEEDIQKTRAQTEVRAKFEDMFAHDQKGFISLYTKTSDGGVGYTENETLKKHPYRDVIKQVFSTNNIPVTYLTREEIAKKDDTQKEKEYLQGTALGYHYNPARDSAQAAGRMGIFSKPKEITNVGGMIQNSKTVLKEAAVENPLRETLLGVEKNTEKNPQEKLKKIASVLSARIKNLSINPNNILKSRLSWIVLAAAIAGPSTKMETSTHNHVENVPVPVSESLNENEVEIKDTWRKYYNFGKTHPDFVEIPEDISKLSANQLKETLIQKYAKSYFDGTNNSRQNLLALGMFGDLVRDDITKGTYDHLPEKGRVELSYLWDALNDISMATSDEKLQAKTYEQAIIEVKEKVTEKEK